MVSALIWTTNRLPFFSATGVEHNNNSLQLKICWNSEHSVLGPVFFTTIVSMFTDVGRESKVGVEISFDLFSNHFLLSSEAIGRVPRASPEILHYEGNKQCSAIPGELLGKLQWLEI